MLPEKTYHYLLIDLASAPDVLALMLKSAADPGVYDKRPDSDRFTLREVLAHLADWDEVFLGRLTQTRDTGNPTLQGLDEGQVALDHNYAQADPVECLSRYRANRAKLVGFLEKLSPEQWTRVGNHTEIGPISLTAQAVLIAAHDGYHREQTVHYLSEDKGN